MKGWRCWFEEQWKVAKAKHSGYISVMNMFSTTITCSGLNELLKIPELVKLREVLLSYNTLGRGGAVSLLKSPLVHNLEKLSLRGTGIGVEDCQALSNILSASPTLKRIDVSRNALPPEAVELIITGLKNHTVLEKLDIEGSLFNLQNCISLASVTQPPRHLNLQYCFIDDKGAIEVARLLNQDSVTSLGWRETLSLSVEPVYILFLLTRLNRAAPPPHSPQSSRQQ